MAPREVGKGQVTDIALLFQEVKDPQLYGSKESPPCDGKPVALNKRLVFGYACALGVVVFMVGGTCCVQALGNIVPPFELGALRYLCQLTVVFPIIVINGLHLIPPRRTVPWLLLSCLFSSAYNVLFYTAGVYLPVGAMGGAEQSLMLIFVAMIDSIMVLDCKLHITMAVILCVTGVILVSQPEFIFQGTLEAATSSYNPICVAASVDSGSYRDLIYLTAGKIVTIYRHDNTTDSEITESSNESFGYILTSAAAAIASVTYFVISKRLNDLSPLITSFWQSISGIFLNAVAMLIFEDPTLPTSWKCWLFMLGHTYGASFGNIFTSISLVIVSPVEGALIYCLQVFVFFVAQYTFMKSINPGKHNSVEIVGAVAIIVGSFVNPIYQLYVKTQKTKEVDEAKLRLLGDEE